MIKLSLNNKVILFGFIFTFFSSFGQSFFLGLFNAPIRNELNITHGQFGSIYASATIFSSMLLIWVGKKIDDYYVNKSLQLYLEGLTYREIERILGVSHVSIMNWVKKYNIKRPSQTNYHPTYKILNAGELGEYFKDATNIKGAGVVVTELGDKFMLIKWERFKS